MPDFGGFRTLWPGHGFEYNDTVYIFLEHVDGATMEFLDTYVVKLAMPTLEIVAMVNMPDMGEFIFGRCVLTDSLAGYRYIYGNKVNWIVQEPFVARCPLDGLFGPWEFWTDRMDADTYRPKFIRVPMALLTGSEDTEILVNVPLVIPNPVKEGKPVRIQGAWISAGTEMEIFDLSGRRVAVKAAPDVFSGAIEFSAPEKPGVYFIRFRQISGNGIKLVVIPY